MRRRTPASSTSPLSVPRQLLRRQPEVSGPDFSLLWMFLAGALLMALASAAGGQTAPAPEPVPRFSGEVTVTEVLLDVLVADRDGNLILGLGPEDFRVEADGNPVELTGLTFYSNRRYLGQADADKLGVDPDAVPDRRYFVLLFDDQRRNGGALLQRHLAATRDAERWIDEKLEPGDRVAVASFDVKLKLHADFTGDREALRAAVRAAATGQEGRAEWPSRRSGGGELALGARLPTGNDLRDATPTIYEALQVLADAAAPIRGRKNLVLFSIGFGDLNSIGQYTRDTRYHQPTVEALNGGNVAVYSVNLAEPGVDNRLADALNDFALLTGGRVFREVVSFTLPLEQIARATNGYYLLSYRVEHAAGEMGYRKVEVDALNPEFRVTARRGYRFGDGDSP